MIMIRMRYRVLALFACSGSCKPTASLGGNDDGSETAGASAQSENGSSAPTSGTGTGDGAAAGTAGADGSGSGGGSTAGASGSGTGESGTGTTAAATGSTTSASLCDAAQGDSPCVTCLKQNCCGELESCGMSATCSCVVECLDAGSMPAECPAQCQAAGGPEAMLAACFGEHCAQGCE
jgi:hypothetical protein